MMLITDEDVDKELEVDVLDDVDTEEEVETLDDEDTELESGHT